MLIHAEITVTPDCPTVKFREPMEKVDLDVELPKILNVQGWGLGTYFNIQFISHDRDKLIKAGKFLVTEETEYLHTANPEAYQPMTKTMSARKAMLLGEWFYPGGLIRSEKEVSEIRQERKERQAKEKIVKWNLGKRAFEVKLGDEVVFSSKDKAEAEKYRDAA